MVSVTGARSGIGEAIARQLLDAGCTVVALQRRPPCIGHDRLLFQSADLSDVAVVRQVGAELAARHPVRHLVNDAGANRPAPLEQATTDDLDYAMALNVRAAMLPVQAFAPGMRQAEFGRTASISSRAVLFLLAPDNGCVTGQTLFVCGRTSVSGSGGRVSPRHRLHAAAGDGSGMTAVRLAPSPGVSAQPFQGAPTVLSTGSTPIRGADTANLR